MEGQKNSTCTKKRLAGRLDRDNIQEKRNIKEDTVKLLRTLWESYKQDPSKLIFSLKVGLAVALASLLILVKAPCKVFGPNAVWAMITVVVIFEYTVGGTFSRGFNRSVGSIVAGILALLINVVADYTCDWVKPVIVGSSVFIVGSVTVFMKQYPAMKDHEYGFRVALFTYCMIIGAAYTSSNPVTTTSIRLYAVLIGGGVTLMVSILIFPSWAGDELHRHIVRNFDCIADALEACVNQYLHKNKRTCEEDRAIQICKSALLSGTKEESLANFALWEPPHGNFSNFFHPWSKYVQVGKMLRHCAYQIVALESTILQHDSKEECHMKFTFETPLRDATMEACAVVKELGNSMKQMVLCPRDNLRYRTHRVAHMLEVSIHSRMRHLLLMDFMIQENPTTKSLHRSFTSLDFSKMNQIDQTTDGIYVLQALAVSNYASMLLGFVQRLEQLVSDVYELGKLARFKKKFDPPSPEDLVREYALC